MSQSEMDAQQEGSQSMDRVMSSLSYFDRDNFSKEFYPVEVPSNASSSNSDEPPVPLESQSQSKDIPYMSDYTLFVQQWTKDPTMARILPFLRNFHPISSMRSNLKKEGWTEWGSSWSTLEDLVKRLQHTDENERDQVIHVINSILFRYRTIFLPFVLLLRDEQTKVRETSVSDSSSKAAPPSNSPTTPSSYLEAISVYLLLEAYGILSLEQAICQTSGTLWNHVEYLTKEGCREAHNLRQQILGLHAHQSHAVLSPTFTYNDQYDQAHVFMTLLYYAPSLSWTSGLSKTTIATLSWTCLEWSYFQVHVCPQIDGFDVERFSISLTLFRLCIRTVLSHFSTESFSVLSLMIPRCHFCPDPSRWLQMQRFTSSITTLLNEIQKNPAHGSESLPMIWLGDLIFPLYLHLEEYEALDHLIEQNLIHCSSRCFPLVMDWKLTTTSENAWNRYELYERIQKVIAYDPARALWGHLSGPATFVVNMKRSIELLVSSRGSDSLIDDFKNWVEELTQETLESCYSEGSLWKLAEGELRTISRCLELAPVTMSEQAHSSLYPDRIGLRTIAKTYFSNLANSLYFTYLFMTPSPPKNLLSSFTIRHQVSMSDANDTTVSQKTPHSHT